MGIGWLVMVVSGVKVVGGVIVGEDSVDGYGGMWD